ncbi:MAG: DUF3784 domain-containing protein [Bacteroidales bacterium]|nr:DUF3784 domain-containing protein [Bacteroidales bacterium]
MMVKIFMAVLLGMMGLIILFGKGDKLIAGYNTASKEEREQVNVKRLRLLMGGFMVVLAILAFLIIEEESITSVMGFGAVMLVLAFVVIALANSWARKK